VEWTRWECRPWYETDGSVGGFIIYTEVITKRKQEEEKLRLSEGKWKSLTENSPDHIMLLNLDYIIQFINHTVPDLTKAQVIGKSNLDFIPTEYHQVAVECFKRVIGSGKPDQFVVKYITAKGKEQFFDSRISPQVDENGKVICLISTSNNITERIRAENALRESRDSFRFLAENAKDMIYRMSLPEGHYEYVSPASSDLFGYTPEEFYNNPILIKQVIHPVWRKYLDPRSPISSAVKVIKTTGLRAGFNAMASAISMTPELPLALSSAPLRISPLKGAT